MQTVQVVAASGQVVEVVVEAVPVARGWRARVTTPLRVCECPFVDALEATALARALAIVELSFPQRPTVH